MLSQRGAEHGCQIESTFSFTKQQTMEDLERQICFETNATVIGKTICFRQKTIIIR